MRPRSPRSFTPPPEAPVVIGYVVVFWRDTGTPSSRLTNADLMERDIAEHEAAAWRKSGHACRVRPVVDTEV